MQQMYALITPEGTTFIGEEDKRRFDAAVDGRASHIIIAGKTLGITSAVSAYPADEFIAMKNRHLMGSGRWMCKHAVIHMSDAHCECAPATRVCDGPMLIVASEEYERQPGPAIAAPERPELPEAARQLSSGKTAVMPKLGEIVHGMKTTQK